jgi:hypothetical protein
MKGHVAEGGAFHSDIAPLPISEPGDIVAGADVSQIAGERNVELAHDRLGL